MFTDQEGRVRRWSLAGLLLTWPLLALGVFEWSRHGQGMQDQGVRVIFITDEDDLKAFNAFIDQIIKDDANARSTNRGTDAGTPGRSPM